MRQETLLLPHGLRRRADLDKGLISLLERAMNFDPALRPTAAQLAEALGRPWPTPAQPAPVGGKGGAA